MAEVKVPKLLHKMSVAHQKAWYKKNNMPLPSHLTGAEGKSAAQAKKDVGQINKQKAKEKEVAAAKVDRTELIKRAAEKRASRTQIAKLRSAFGGEVPGARYDDPIAMARAGMPIRGYRLGESSKPDASMAMTDQLKMKMISDKDKMTLAKVAALMSRAKNKDKKNEYVRQLGLKAMKAGAIDPARGHSPTRFGRETLRKEEVEQIDETNGEYNRLGHPKPGSVDVDPTPGDVLPSYKKRKPAMYKPKNHVAEDSESVNELKDATLKSYLEKRPSPKIRDIARKETVGKPEERQKDIERANLTRIGRARAKAKLLKRNPPPRKQPEYDPTDRGYGQGRYMGDSIELEGSVMNEVSKKEAEAMFGGPVKEKPKMPAGKQPEGYRYVRSLARKAMKAGMKKEEVALDEMDKSQPAAGRDSDTPFPTKPIKVTDKQRASAKLMTRELLNLAKKQLKKEEVEQMYEEPKDAADEGEYDYEGDMAKSQLRSIMANSKRMHDMLEENTNLPEWVQSKITLAEDYIVTAANYMEGEMNEEFTDEELAELAEAKMTDAQMKKREKYVKSMKPVSDWEKRYPGRGEQVMYATATKMAMKEETDQIDESVTHWEYTGTVNGKDYSLTIPRGDDLVNHLNHKKIMRQNPHLEPHEAKAVAETSGEDEEHVEVEHNGKTYTHYVTNDQEPRMVRTEEVEQIEEGKGYAPGWMLKKDKDLGAKVKEKIDLAKKRQASYGNPKAGISVKEEVVAESEGKVAVTPKEKALAAHHGDPKKITYGDVIKARIKSAAEKAMKKGK